MASIESQANAAITGLWADASYGKTDFDAYRTDRSGLLFGVQGATETLTLGAVLSAGTGNVKSDSLVSQDWNDVGGPVYGAYRFGPAALTASALYERHEGKAQGQKRHADVLGASLKVPADAALGGMTVTPYAGWRVIDVDHADAEDRVVVRKQSPVWRRGLYCNRITRPNIRLVYISPCADSCRHRPCRLRLAFKSLCAR